MGLGTRSASTPANNPFVPEKTGVLTSPLGINCGSIVYCEICIFFSILPTNKHDDAGISFCNEAVQ